MRHVKPIYQRNSRSPLHKNKRNRICYLFAFGFTFTNPIRYLFCFCLCFCFSLALALACPVNSSNPSSFYSYVNKIRQTDRVDKAECGATGTTNEIGAQISTHWPWPEVAIAIAVVVVYTTYPVCPWALFRAFDLYLNAYWGQAVFITLCIDALCPQFIIGWAWR